MEYIKIKLSVFWISLMLVYLLGDVLRIFAQEFKAGGVLGTQMTQKMYLGIAVVMLLPILMVMLSITLDNPVNRWLNIIMATVFFIFNIIGIPTYKSAYDIFLIIVGLIINVLIMWQAWQWN